MGNLIFRSFQGFGSGQAFEVRLAEDEVLPHAALILLLPDRALLSLHALVLRLAHIHTRVGGRGGCLETKGRAQPTSVCRI